MIYAVIVAGGSGSRMNSKVPKQFLELDGKPILYHTVQRFLNSIPELIIILVLPKDFDGVDFLRTHFPHHTNILLTVGGETRYQSVQHGLSMIEGDGIVMIQDGVRPFVSRSMLLKCIETAKEMGNAIPCIDLKDSLRIIDEEGNKAVARNDFKAIQTPQTFQFSMIKQAYKQDYRPEFTDDASVVENLGIKINLVQGNEENIKITTPQDLVLAEWILKNSTVG